MTLYFNRSYLASIEFASDLRDSADDLAQVAQNHDDKIYRSQLLFQAASNRVKAHKLDAAGYDVQL